MLEPKVWVNLLGSFVLIGVVYWLIIRPMLRIERVSREYKRGLDYANKLTDQGKPLEAMLVIDYIGSAYLGHRCHAAELGRMITDETGDSDRPLQVLADFVRDVKPKYLNDGILRRKKYRDAYNGSTS